MGMEGETALGSWPSPLQHFLFRPRPTSDIQSITVASCNAPRATINKNALICIEEGLIYGDLDSWPPGVRASFEEALRGTTVLSVPRSVLSRKPDLSPSRLSHSIRAHDDYLHRAPRKPTALRVSHSALMKREKSRPPGVFWAPRRPTDIIIVAFALSFPEPLCPAPSAAKNHTRRTRPMIS